MIRVAWTLVSPRRCTTASSRTTLLQWLRAALSTRARRFYCAHRATTPITRRLPLPAGPRVCRRNHKMPPPVTPPPHAPLLACRTDVGLDHETEAAVSGGSICNLHPMKNPSFPPGFSRSGQYDAAFWNGFYFLCVNIWKQIVYYVCWDLLIFFSGNKPASQAEQGLFNFAGSTYSISAQIAAQARAHASFARRRATRKGYRQVYEHARCHFPGARVSVMCMHEHEHASRLLGRPRSPVYLFLPHTHMLFVFLLYAGNTRCVLAMQPSTFTSQVVSTLFCSPG